MEAMDGMSRLYIFKWLDQDLTLKNGIKDSHLEVNTSKKITNGTVDKT